MAEVTLGRYELERGAIPATCLVCGAPATHEVTRTFSCRRDGELTSIGNPLMKMTLDAPMCANHRSHWSRRVVFNWIGLLIVAVNVILSLLVFRMMMNPFPAMDTLCFGGILLVGLLVLVNMWFDFTIVKPTQITAHAITLTRVSEDFVADLEKMRQALPNKEEMDFRKGGGEHPEPPPTDGSFRPGRM